MYVTQKHNNINHENLIPLRVYVTHIFQSVMSNTFLYMCLINIHSISLLPLHVFELHTINHRYLIHLHNCVTHNTFYLSWIPNTFTQTCYTHYIISVMGALYIYICVLHTLRSISQEDLTSLHMCNTLIYCVSLGYQMPIPIYVYIQQKNKVSR